MTSCTALLSISYLLRESPLLFFNNNICQPRILCRVETEADLDKILAPTTKFEIKVEDVTIGYTDDFVKAFAMLLSTYYVFNIAYAEKSQASLHLIQKLFLEIADGVKVPHKILSLISKIKKLLL